MSIISITKLYELLSGKAGKETAENLTSFIFWIGQVIATFGFILLFLKKYPAV
jgi:hypothetical protein